MWSIEAKIENIGTWKDELTEPDIDINKVERKYPSNSVHGLERLTSFWRDEYSTLLNQRWNRVTVSDFG